MSDYTAMCFRKMKESEKMAFLQIFAKMASIDGHFDECEKAFIMNAAIQMGVAIKKIAKIFDDFDEQKLLKKASAIKDRRVALELIKELCYLAHTDEELSDEEVLFIGRIGEAMGIKPEKIEEISNWVIDRLIWLNQEKIIFEEI